METNPSAKRQPTQITTEQKVKTISFLITMPIIIWLVFFHECSPKTSKEHTKLDAYCSAQNFVKKNLSTPATAEFHDSYDNCVKQENDTTFIVNSFVDAENVFGAKIRSGFSCKIIYTSDGMTSCEELVIK